MTKPQTKRSVIQRWILVICGLVPLKLLLFLVWFSYKGQENYPFSHFPMYRSFQPDSYYLYITDSKGEPIPIGAHGFGTSQLKKVHVTAEREIKKRTGRRIREFTDEDRKESGEVVLRWLYSNWNPGRVRQVGEYRPLRVVYAHISMGEGDVVTTERVIADEADLSGLPPLPKPKPKASPAQP